MSVRLNTRYTGVKILKYSTIHEQLLECINNHDPDGLKEVIKTNDKSFDINHIYVTEPKMREYNVFQILCTNIVDIKEDEAQIPEYDRSKWSYIKCAQLLMENNIDVTHKDPDYKLQAIDFAVLTGESQIVKMVLDKHQELGISTANIDLISTIILFFEKDEIIDEEYMDIIDQLIDSGVDINTLDYDMGVPPIYLAASLRFDKVIQLILSKRGYDIDLDYYVDEKGKTARMLINKYNLYEEVLPSKNGNGYQLLYKYLHDRNTNEFIDKYKLYKEEMSDDKKFSFLLRAVQLGADEIVEYMINDTDEVFRDYVTLLELACIKGYYKVVEVLLEEVTNIAYNIQHVKDLVRVVNTTENTSNCVDYTKCLLCLLNGRKIELNKKDKFGKTVLEYAIQYKNYKMIRILLNFGSSMIVFDEKGEERSLVLEINPTIIEKHFDDSIGIHDDKEKCQKKRRKGRSTEEHIDYTINFSSILPPRLLDESTTPDLNSTEYLPEMAVLKRISDESEYNSLLGHPIVTIFVALKWFKIRKFFYTDSLLYTFYAILLNVYIFNMSLHIYLVLMALFLIVQFWEVIQMGIFGLRYFTYEDNWLRFFLSWLTFSILVIHNFPYDSDKSILKQVHAVASLISFINFFFLIGHFPKLSTSVIMIKVIYHTLLKSFLTYSILILAFATSFYVLFCDDYSYFFGNYGLSLFKTILMSTGEYDSTNLNLEKYPYVSYPILVFFVTLISISLLNLLTGLAVSDINMIKKNAELYGEINRIVQIYRIENIFLKHRLLKHFPFLGKICLFSVFSRETSVNIDAKNKVMEISSGRSIPKKVDENILSALRRIVQKKRLNF